MGKRNEILRIYSESEKFLSVFWERSENQWSGISKTDSAISKKRLAKDLNMYFYVTLTKN